MEITWSSTTESTTWDYSTLNIFEKSTLAVSLELSITEETVSYKDAVKALQISRVGGCAPYVLA